MKSLKMYGVMTILTILLSSMVLHQEVYADSIPNVKWLKQERFAWCWAASSQVLLRFFIQGFSKTQAQIAATVSSNTSPDGDTVPRKKVAECIILSSKPTPTSAPLLNCTFLDRPLTWKELKERADKNLPFTIMYDFHIRPYYHCVVFAGYLGDSTKIKIVDPDELRNSRTYINTYKELITGAQYKDIWRASILPEMATSINDMTHAMNNSRAFEFFINRQKQRHSFTIVSANARVDSRYALTLFNARGTSLFSTQITPGSSHGTLPVLAPGMYTIQVQGAGQTIQKAVTIIQ